jgi:ectoine hydroxylase-related dioxygenase (phytanoyl-CoA dioxygenase family)
MEWLEIVKENSYNLKWFVGPDLMYQKEPYLRIARPNKKEDNIGIHRDTDYGASKDEFVFWIPFVDALNGAALRIYPDSDKMEFPYVQTQNDDAPKGSVKHWLGFRYAPKKYSKEIEDQCIPVHCPFGSAILFNCNVIHGQVENTERWTRFSTDIRLVDARGEFTKSRGLHGEIYARLSAQDL